MLCIARQINFPETLNELINFPGAWPTHAAGFDPARIGVCMDARKAAGKQVYTGAYMIRAESDPMKPWYSWSKQRYMGEIVLGRVWADRNRFSDVLAGPGTLEAMHTELMRYTGWGPFMSYQAVVDMRFCPKVLGSAPDRDHWAAAGPGTLRGLWRLYAEDRVNASQDLARDRLRLLWPQIVEASGVEMDFSDVPNILCEFDKYQRVAKGEGRPRSLYKGR